MDSNDNCGVKSLVEGKPRIGMHVYTNMDHTTDEKIKQRLLDDPSLCSCHTAVHFCGYVWHENGIWNTEIWRFHSIVGVVYNKDFDAMVKHTIDTYGSD